MSCFVTVVDTIGTRIRVQGYVNRYPDIAKPTTISPDISSANSKTDAGHSWWQEVSANPHPLGGVGAICDTLPRLFGTVGLSWTEVNLTPSSGDRDPAEFWHRTGSKALPAKKLGTFRSGIN